MEGEDVCTIGIDEWKKDLLTKLPKVTVPNPDGENRLVLFKPSSELDGKTKRVFGYRADQLKGIQMKIFRIFCGWKDYGKDRKHT
jgi:hypothetical protein